MYLILLPAVDVVEGRAVRLVQGVAGSETEYGSALDAALGWQRDGAEWIHLVDLDAAFGRGSNRELLADVRGEPPEDLEYPGDGEVLRRLWIATRSSLRAVLEHVTLADLAKGDLPGRIGALTEQADAWHRR